MLKELLEQTIQEIEPLDKQAMDLSKKRWDNIAKPLNSLGLLEDTIVKIAGITRNSTISIAKKALVIMCADNGIVEEGVTEADSNITAVIAKNFVERKTSACIMADYANIDVFPIDIGMNSDIAGISMQKISYGTKNIIKEPAMTEEQALSAIESGIQTALAIKQMGYEILALGEIGVGNTTTSSAITSVLLNRSVREVTGKGAGLTEEALRHKIQTIKKAIFLHQPNPLDPIDVLAKVGGYDIAGLTGVILGAASQKIPIVLDGFISSVAALVASRLCTQCTNYLLASHVSQEPAGYLLLKELGLKPLLICKMFLGEGTGAIAAFPIFDMAAEIYKKANTFKDIHIEPY